MKRTPFGRCQGLEYYSLPPAIKVAADTCHWSVKVSCEEGTLLNTLLGVDALRVFDIAFWLPPGVDPVSADWIPVGCPERAAGN